MVSRTPRSPPFCECRQRAEMAPAGAASSWSPKSSASASTRCASANAGAESVEWWGSGAAAIVTIVVAGSPSVPVGAARIGANGWLVSH